MLNDELKEEFEAAVAHLSDTTKAYIHAQQELMERYVERMNANNRDPQVWLKLQKELSEKTEALRAEYLAERERQGLPSEVGWMSSGKTS